MLLYMFSYIFQIYIYVCFPNFHKITLRNLYFITLFWNVYTISLCFYLLVKLIIYLEFCMKDSFVIYILIYTLI